MSVNWVEVDRLAQAHRMIDPASSEEALNRQLRLWWCIKYNKPFKDPLLDTYTLDELAYEYLVWFYMAPENDPVEKKRKQLQDNSDAEWIRQQLAKASQEKINKIKDSEKPSEPIPPPTIPDLPEISTNFDK